MAKWLNRPQREEGVEAGSSMRFPVRHCQLIVMLMKLFYILPSGAVRAPSFSCVFHITN